VLFYLGTLTSGYDFQYGVSWSAVVTMALKCAVFELGHGTDRQTDGQTDGS